MHPAPVHPLPAEGRQGPGMDVEDAVRKARQNGRSDAAQVARKDHPVRAGGRQGLGQFPVGGLGIGGGGNDPVRNSPRTGEIQGRRLRGIGRKEHDVGGEAPLPHGLDGRPEGRAVAGGQEGKLEARAHAPAPRACSNRRPS